MKNFLSKKLKNTSLNLINILGVVALLLLIILVYGFSQTYRDVIDSEKRILEVSEIKADLLLYDEVLTMSARMAVLTGDEKWEKRYRFTENKLDESIKKATELYPDILSTYIAETSYINQNLIKFENNAFELIRQGDNQRALNLLSNDEYQGFKKQYTKSILSLNESLLKKNIAEEERLNSQELNYLIAFLLVLTLFLLVWLVLNLTLKHERLRLFQNLEKTSKTDSFLKGILENAVDGIISIDKKGTILSINPAIEKMFGYSEQELIGQNVKMLISSQYHEEHDAYFRKYLETGKKNMIDVRREVAGRRKDGAAFTMELSMSENKTGSSYSLTSFVRDISKQKQAELEIRDALNFSFLIMENIPDLVFIKDSDFKIVQANSKFLNAYPDSLRDKVIGYTTLESYNVEEVKIFLEQDRIALEKGHSEVEEDIQFPDGETRNLFTQKIRFDDINGEQYILGISRDISDRKKAEEQSDEYHKIIKDQKEYYENLFKYLNVPAFILDIEHKVILWNRAVELLTGVKASEILGTSNHQKVIYKDERLVFADLVLNGAFDEPELYPDELEYPVEIEESIMPGGKRAQNWVDFPRSGRPPVYLTFDAGPIYNTEGKKIGVIQVMQDITTMKNMEDSIKEKNELLLRSNEELEQFAYVASHDLQEPLRMVASYTNLLSVRYKDKLDADANDFINYAVDGAKRMQALINDLLTFSRLNKKGREFLRIDTDKLCQDVINDLSLSIKEVNADVSKDELPKIKGDELQIRQLFQNLVSNAIKYSDPERKNKIHISATIEHEKYKFIVTDSGIGIAPEYFERIFIIFKRLHNKEAYSGTGIGLSICKKIVKLHDGEIGVESEPGQGSSFYFTISRNL